MTYLRKNKSYTGTRQSKILHRQKAFTLIELMVVVAIIGVLALIGLRVYDIQQEKAKGAIIKADVAEVQLLLQTVLIDHSFIDKEYWIRMDKLGKIIDDESFINVINPYKYENGENLRGREVVWLPKKNQLEDRVGVSWNKYVVVVASPNSNEFIIQGLDRNGKLFGEILTVKK